MNRYLLAFTLFAACINPVPSRAEFHPVKWRHDPFVDDIMGSGFEDREVQSRPRLAACEEPPEGKVARQWRDLAESMRRLAALSGSPAERERMLAQAEAYEARARLWEAKHRPTSTG